MKRGVAAAAALLALCLLPSASWCQHPGIYAPGGVAAGTITGGTFHLPGKSEADRAEGERRHAELLAAIAREKGLEPELLRPIFEHLGQRNPTIVQMRADAE